MKRVYEEAPSLPSRATPVEVRHALASARVQGSATATLATAAILTRTFSWTSSLIAVAEAGLCTSDETTTSEQCRSALYNSSVISGYGELLR